PRCACRRPGAARRPARTPPRPAAAPAARAGGRRHGGPPRPPRRPAARGAAAIRAAPATLPRDSSSSAGGPGRTHLHLDALPDHVRHLEGPQPVPAGHRRGLPLAHGPHEGVDLLAQRVALPHLEILQGEGRVAIPLRLGPADAHPALLAVQRGITLPLTHTHPPPPP